MIIIANLKKLKASALRPLGLLFYDANSENLVSTTGCKDERCCLARLRLTGKSTIKTHNVRSYLSFVNGSRLTGSLTFMKRSPTPHIRDQVKKALQAETLPESIDLFIYLSANPSHNEQQSSCTHQGILHSHGTVWKVSTTDLNVTLANHCMECSCTVRFSSN